MNESIIELYSLFFAGSSVGALLLSVKSGTFTAITGIYWYATGARNIKVI